MHVKDSTPLACQIEREWEEPLRLAMKLVMEKKAWTSRVYLWVSPKIPQEGNFHPCALCWIWTRHKREPNKCLQTEDAQFWNFGGGNRFHSCLIDFGWVSVVVVCVLKKNPDILVRQLRAPRDVPCSPSFTVTGKLVHVERTVIETTQERLKENTKEMFNSILVQEQPLISVTFLAVKYWHLKASYSSASQTFFLT